MARYWAGTFAACAALLATACAAPAPTDANGLGASFSSTARGPAGRAEAARAALAEEVMAADRAFAEMARTVGVAEAFTTYMAADGKLLGAGPDPVVGTEAIFAVFAAFPEEADFTWSPVEAVVSADGDLAVTWGTYSVSFPGTDGEAEPETGRYMTVWRKDAEGRWRGVLDIGT